MAHQSGRAWERTTEQQNAFAARDWAALRASPRGAAQRDVLRASQTARVAELHAQGFGPATFGKLNAGLQKQINQQIKQAISEKLQQHGPSRAEVNAAAAAGKTLKATMPSSVFASLTWKATDKGGTEGVAHAEFFRGGAIEYDYEMTRDDFVDWADDESLGQFFNANVR